MRIITDNGQYDLPVGFVLELERKNPFFSKVGEKSIAVTLPLTPNNLKIIGYSNKIESKNKPVTTLNVLIEEGVTRLFAKQVIHKTTKDGIATTFYLNVGAFWTSIKDKKLKDVMAEHSYSSATLMGDLQASMKETSNFDFMVFPVACNNGNDTYFILNETELKDADGTPYLIGRKARRIAEGDKNTDVPIGYGITAFLKMHRILDIVIRSFGYTLANNFLQSDDFKTLCQLNNCADAVVIDRLDYTQLVPDITVQDLLDIVRTNFGCEFIPDEVTKEIRIDFFKDQLLSPANIDLTTQKVSDFEFDLPAFSQVILTQEVSLDNASVEEETLEKFLKKYKRVGAVSEVEWSDSDIISRYDAVLRLAEGRFYSIEYDGITARKEAVSSVFFNYNKGGDLLTQEMELKNTAVPVVEVKNILMPFVGNIVNVNTAIKEKSGELKEEKKTSNKNVMLCFGKFQIVDTLSVSYGSPFNYNNKGERDGDYSLQSWGPDGIFHRFYKEIDSFYRHSNILVQAGMLLTEHQKNIVSEIQPVVIKNQLFIPDTISYTIGQKVYKNCLFRTLKLYEPFNISEEQSIPEIITEHTSDLYFWEYRDNSAELVPAPSGYDDYSYRLSGEISKPGVPPTEAQYELSQTGTIFYQTDVDIIVEHYVMSNLVGQSNERLTYWYIVSKK